MYHTLDDLGEHSQILPTLTFSLIKRATHEIVETHRTDGHAGNTHCLANSSTTLLRPQWIFLIPFVIENPLDFL